MRVKGVIFDLDGVLADTAGLHYRAWKRLANELGIDFDEAFNERLKGVDRMGSLALILDAAGHNADAAARDRLAARKNSFYVELIAALGPDDLLPGAKAALRACRRAGLSTALASASRNAPAVIERLEIADQFDYVADASKIARSKPDPEIFLTAAAGLQLSPGQCVGVEDAAAGVEAIKRAGMPAIGVGDRDELAAADYVIASIASFDLSADWFLALRP